MNMTENFIGNGFLQGMQGLTEVKKVRGGESSHIFSTLSHYLKQELHLARYAPQLMYHLIFTVSLTGFRTTQETSLYACLSERLKEVLKFSLTMGITILWSWVSRLNDKFSEMKVSLTSEYCKWQCLPKKIKCELEVK